MQKNKIYFDRDGRLWVLRWYDLNGKMNFVTDETFEGICLRAKYCLK